MARSEREGGKSSGVDGGKILSQYALENDKLVVVSVEPWHLNASWNNETDTKGSHRSNSPTLRAQKPYTVRIESHEDCLYYYYQEKSMQFYLFFFFFLHIRAKSPSAFIMSFSFLKKN